MGPHDGRRRRLTVRGAISVGGRTYIRKPTAGDRDEYLQRVVASKRHLEPYVFAATDHATFAHWIENGQRDTVEQFLVCRREDDAIAGFVNLNNITRGALQQAAAGWAAFLPHAAQGHLSEGLALVLEVAFTQLRLHRVEANIQPANERSRRLAIRAGMRLEGFSPRLLIIDGQWRDHERWAIDQETWESGRTSSTV